MNTLHNLELQIRASVSRLYLDWDDQHHRQRLLDAATQTGMACDQKRFPVVAHRAFALADTLERLAPIDPAVHRILLPAALTLADLLSAVKVEPFAETNTATEEEPSSKNRSLPAKTNCRILVAEDNPANQVLLRMQVNALGLEADIAADGAEALALYQANDYDLILADKNMPKMDGLTLARTIRAGEKDTHVPIIAITALHHSETNVPFREAGIDDTLPKPIELDHLRHMIKRWLPQAIPDAAAGSSALQPSAPKDTTSTLDLYCMARTVGDTDNQQTIELIRIFIAMAHSDLPVCRSYLTQRNARALSLGMHKLKSSARMIGALRFAALAEDIENAAKGKRYSAAKLLLDELDIALDELESAAASISLSRQANAITPASCWSSQRKNDSLTAEDILEGIRRDEFEVYFQPKVDVASLHVVGVEALARWTHHDKRIAPDVFITAAINLGLIGQLSEVLVTKALFGGACLGDSGFPLMLAINISSHWLSDSRLTGFLTASARATGFPIERLILDITEPAAIAQIDGAHETLAQLRQRGFKLSIDGVERNLYWQCMASAVFAEIKLDREFVQSAMDRTELRGKLIDCIEQAHSLNCTAVAEGVETQSDMDMLRGYGCDQAQGWLVSEAMTLDHLLEWLAKRQTGTLLS